jgi:glycosyltransferase involved in cell wall biosynthesis
MWMGRDFTRNTFLHTFLHTFVHASKSSRILSLWEQISPRVANMIDLAGTVGITALANLGSEEIQNHHSSLSFQDDEFSKPTDEVAEVKFPRTSYSLSVVLPAYNEEAVIEKTIAKIHYALNGWMRDFEVIVVNDGSRDRTAELVATLAKHDARIRLINHQVNQGYGAALATGFRSSSKELVFFMDADGQFDIYDLEKFFPLIECYDAVFGYRNPRCDPWIRKWNAWGWKQLGRLFFGIHVRDIDCAFKLYRANFFKNFELETRGAMINTEMLYKFAHAGYTYTEVGVRHLPREEGTATGAKLSVILRAFRELVYYARKWHREEQGKVRQ